MQVILTVVKGPEEGRLIEFKEPCGFIIGRASDADLKLPPDDPYVSRRHIFLEICPPTCRARDIGKTNPAHINGHPFAEQELTDGDILEVGYTQLKICITAQIAMCTRSCRACGKPITLMPDEPEPDRCPDCAEKERLAARPAPLVTAVCCSSCGADLTQQANSDGRAQELYNIAIYVCENCHPPGDEFAGSLIGDYQVCRRLGEGGMGAVYLVYHRPTARVLALKQMKELQDELLVKRFDREMRLMKGLAHRNIVRCLETGIDDQGAPYLVTEYLSNGDLEGEVSRCGGRMKAERAVPLICQVLDGLEYLHTQSIIHRDIKPQNILLGLPMTERTGTGLPTPKLADLGLAKSYARAGGTRLTKPGTGLGTLMFMPPEQVRDAGEVRDSADIYATGVTLYYLLTGQYSFDFPTPADILAFQKQNQDMWKKPQEALQALMKLRRIMHPFQIILSEKPIPIEKRDSSIPRKLAAVVDKAVYKDARDRFQSAAEFRSALQQALR